MDDDFGVDEDFLSALTASEASVPKGPSSSRPAPPAGSGPPSRVQQPAPQKIQQPTPQRLDRPPPNNNGVSGVKQPTPQALPQRSAGSSILVSPRQKGNPVLACLKSLPWEYSDIPADYGLGLTTCALFLSLKYHRLHPEYIYTRIRNLQGRYNLRILLTMVDIPNHEDSLRELAKTSLVNNVTLILTWSAAEAARYLELYKSYEHASAAAIRGAQATSYAERLVGFATVPRTVHKADAVALVSTFGSLRAAVNADPETIGVISGWGEKKVQAWCAAVDEPFRGRAGTAAAAKRAAAAQSEQGGGVRRGIEDARPLGAVPLREMMGAVASASSSAAQSQKPPPNKRARIEEPGSLEAEDEEEAELAAAIEASRRTAEEEARARSAVDSGATGSSSAAKQASASRPNEELTDGVAAALARLREGG